MQESTIIFMAIVVTGGAGFIGSCIIRSLNEVGIEDIIVVDHIASTNKWRNLKNKKYLEYVNKAKFISNLYDYKNITAIIHMGACSSTAEKDFEFLWENNVEYTKLLWKYCADYQCQFIYASSAAVYGNGEVGFDENIKSEQLSPMNGYGYTKLRFDQWLNNKVFIKDIHENIPLQTVGLRFFNVYGPNEYYKGTMSSMIYHGYKQIKLYGEMRLYKSYHPMYSDGEQLRDFVYVKDICSVVLFFLVNKEYNGLFNVGTSIESSFNELAYILFDIMGIARNIIYIEMPNELKKMYQYHTKANIDKLRKIGYKKPFFSIKDGIKDYVQNFLEKDFLTY